MKPRTRRVVQAVLFEGIAVSVVAPALALVLSRPMGSTFWLAAFMSGVALAWNYVFNTLFERWEAAQVERGRSFSRRLAHGAGFEGGLVLMLVPVMAVWLDIPLLQALIADLSILAFFFFYTIGFTWLFDRFFGLPESALQKPAG